MFLFQREIEVKVKYYSNIWPDDWIYQPSFCWGIVIVGLDMFLCCDSFTDLLLPCDENSTMTPKNHHLGISCSFFSNHPTSQSKKIRPYQLTITIP